jgi:hypothetical protein
MHIYVYVITNQKMYFVLVFFSLQFKPRIFFYEMSLKSILNLQDKKLLSACKGILLLLRCEVG